ncbi:hypothetical protein ACFVFQ_37095 [Streptomyces sp. NPDC057743]|uniref:hypothetical protein n=1 Tax=Streptomyces sp. NPDC057743 TaxID=3346236 RepID=UPI0036D0D138
MIFENMARPTLRQAPAPVSRGGPVPGSAARQGPRAAERAQFARWAASYGNELRLLTDAGNNWGNAKAAYVGRPGAPMRQLAAFRREYVDTVLKALLEGFKGARTAAPGSVNETSDYDVAVLGGQGTWWVLAEFNKIMREVWGTESGVTFDTNVYVDLVEPPKSNLMTDDASWQMRGGRPTTLPGWQRVQEVASLAKIRRFMPEEAWQTFSRAVADAVMAPQSRAGRKAADRFQQTRWTESLLSSADRLYRAYVRDVARVLRMQGYGDADTTMDDEQLVRHLEEHDENAVMRARNVLYAIHMRGAQNLARSFLAHESGPGGEGWRSKSSIAELNARAQVYAMEAYHAAGPVFDIVHRLQAKRITADDLVGSDYGQSFNEQFGDALKDLHHYGDDLGKALYQSSKYVNRMTAAADELLQRDGGTLPPDAKATLEALRELSDGKGVLRRLRAGDDEELKHLTEQQKSALAQEEAVRILNTRSLEEFRQKLTRLAHAVLVLRYAQPQ